MNTNLLFISVDYARPISYAEQALSLLSNYFNLGGTRVTIIIDNNAYITNENISWKTTAKKITSYILLFPLTLSLIAVYVFLLTQHKFVIINPNTNDPLNGYNFNNHFTTHTALSPQPSVQDKVAKASALFEQIIGRTPTAVCQLIEDKERREFWKGLSLQQKEYFVEHYSKDTDKQSKQIRILFQKTIYQTTKKSPDWSLLYQPVRWISNAEMVNNLKGTDLCRLTPQDLEAIASTKYFHATKEQTVPLILKSGQVLVQHKQKYKGAFVSALKPEWQFGAIAFGFKRNIEYASGYHSCWRDEQGCWLGFEKPIQVTPDTLSCLVLQPHNKGIKTQVRTWLDANGFNKVPVIILDPVQCTHLNSRPLGIPVEWVHNVS